MRRRHHLVRCLDLTDSTRVGQTHPGEPHKEKERKHSDSNTSTSDRQQGGCHDPQPRGLHRSMTRGTMIRIDGIDIDCISQCATRPKPCATFRRTKGGRQCRPRSRQSRNTINLGICVSKGVRIYRRVLCGYRGVLTDFFFVNLCLWGDGALSVFVLWAGRRYKVLEATKVGGGSQEVDTMCLGLTTGTGSVERGGWGFSLYARAMPRAYEGYKRANPRIPGFFFIPSQANPH